MLSIILTFIVILLSSYIIGRAGLSLFGYKGVSRGAYDLSIVAGLIISCLYAQIYSLFAGVSFGAFVGLIIITLCSGIYLYKSGKRIDILSDIKTVKKGQWILMAVFGLAVLLWTDLSPQHYDTYLYHAQAIHWIEEYGIVKGLGNLHFRFAYNSAMMPLQALYSFAWLGRSLHPVNGCFTLFILCYLVLTFYKRDKLEISDIMKLGMMIYVLYDSFHMSSPNTDTMALLLVYYIIIKWQEYIEDGRDDYEEYGLLCIFIVFATTLKLSVGIMVLLVIYPAVFMIKHKDGIAVLKHIITGVLILIPYLIRNIIISGYIIYPYELTAIKSLDWRMPEAVLKADRAEIIAWGRGNMDTSRNGEPVYKWIGQWYAGINILWKLLLILTVLALLIIIAMLIKQRGQNKLAEINLIAACVCGIVFWIMTAPLPRYGTIYMITLPAIALGMLIKNLSLNNKKWPGRLASIALVMSAAAYLVIFGGYIKLKNISGIPLLLQGDYENHEVSYEDFYAYKIGVPVSGDQTGYEPFPTAPYTGIEDRIELRGESLSEGFRAVSDKES